MPENNKPTTTECIEYFKERSRIHKNGMTTNESQCRKDMLSAGATQLIAAQDMANTGYHDTMCNFANDMGKCNCGWDKALTAWREAGGE